MGHFGRKVIGISWLTLAYLCLMLNYLGQGALLLSVSAGQIYIPIVNWTLVVLVAFYRIVRRCGFMDEVDDPRDLAAVRSAAVRSA